MKKIFSFMAAMMVAVCMNAEVETVYDWSNNIGTTTMAGTTAKGTVSIYGKSTDCIAFSNGYTVDGEVKNYLEIAPASGTFLAGDIVSITFCIKNSDATKYAYVGFYSADGASLAVSGAAANTNSSKVDPSEYQFALESDLASVRLGRKDGNTKLCVSKVEVIRGGEIIIQAGEPIFSMPGGEYHEAISVELTSSNADAIYYRRDGGEYQLYSTPIEISEFDVDVVIDAYATIEGGENSKTVTATYLLTEFLPRPVFQARTIYEFSGITSDEVIIRTPAVAEKSTYTSSGKTIPSVNYNTMAHGERDSFMVVSAVGRENIQFRYKNSASKTNVVKFAEKYVQFDAKNFEVWVDGVQEGDTVVFVVTTKGGESYFELTGTSIAEFDGTTACYLTPYQPDDDEDPCYTDGIVITPSDATTKDNYSGWQDMVYTVDEGRTIARVKETAGGVRIAKILVGAYREGSTTGVENVFSAKKATKRIENGQVVIIKADGRKFNLLGAEIK